MMVSRLIDTEMSDQWQYYYCDGTTSESTNARWPAYAYTYLRMVELPNANQFLRKNSRTIPSALSAFICMARATCNCLHPYLLVSGFSRYQRSLACTCQPAPASLHSPKIAPSISPSTDCRLGLVHIASSGVNCCLGTTLHMEMCGSGKII